MHDLYALGAKVHRESAADSEHLDSVQAPQWHVDHWHADRSIALRDRSIDVEADNTQIESCPIEMLGGADGIQLRASDSHVVDDEHETDGLAAISVDALRVRHGGSVCMTVESLALCIEFGHVKRAIWLTSANLESSLAGPPVSGLGGVSTIYPRTHVRVRPKPITV